MYPRIRPRIEETRSNVLSTMAPCYYYDQEEEAYMPLHLEEPTAALRREIVQMNWRLAALHAQMAQVSNQKVLPHSAPAISRRAKLRNRKVGMVAKPDSAKADKEQPTETKVTLDKGQQTGASISELKDANRKIIEDLLPALRDRLVCCTTTKEETMLFFEALMADHHLAVRPALQDAIVLSVVDKYGCSSRTAFDDALKEIFGDQIDAWQARLHNSLFHTIRVNKIPCFGKKRRLRKSKPSKAIGAPKAITGAD